MLLETALTQIANLSCWVNSDGWQFAIRSVLYAAGQTLRQTRSLAWLPFRCAEATGCPPERAIPVAAAWLLLYVAARLFDAVEDGHFRPEDWAGVGQAQAINVAGAFLVAIPSALAGLEEPRLSDELRVDFQRAALQMAAGQHADLSGWPDYDEGAVERYWQIATAKSGVPFALACRAGARLGNPPAEALDAYADFGRAVGQLAQVCDDYKDIYEPTNLSDFQIGRASLPIIYGQTVASPAARERIETLLIRAATDARAISQLQQLLDDLGARYYLLLQIELLGEQAEDALRRASVTGPNLGRLQELIPHVAERNRRE